MKKVHKMMSFLRNALMVSFLVCVAACSSDNEGNSESGKGSAYTTVDGRTVKYEHCYVIPYEEDGVARYSLEAFNIDPMYYKQHPEKVKDDMLYSYFALDFPASSINESATKDFDIEIDYDISLKRLLIDDDSDIDESTIPVAPTHIWYTYDWVHHKKDQNLAISKSGNTFKVTGTDIVVLASEMGVDEGISNDARQTVCSFGFESNNIYQVEFENVKLVTDAKTVQMLKSLKQK